MRMLPRCQRVCVVREDLFLLTKDTMKTVILGQFMFWSEQMKDTDRYIREETERLREEGINANVSPSHGWISKKTEDLLEDCMLNISRQTGNRLLQSLVEDGYLLARNHPEHKWDKTKQYRVDFVRIQEELHKLGYLHSELAWLSQEPNDGDFGGMSNRESNTSTRMLTGSVRESNVSARAPGESVRESDGEHSVINKVIKSNTENKDDADPHARTEDSKGPAETPPVSQTTFASGRDTSPPDNSANPFLEIDFAMQKNTGNGRYIAKEGDYRAIRELLESGVPLNFILSGIDYTFQHYADRNPRSFTYCAAVVKRLWALELEKEEAVQPADWAQQQGQRRPERQTTGQPARDGRYTAFYELFPEL